MALRGHRWRFGEEFASSNDSEDDDEDDFLYGVENEDVADQSATKRFKFSFTIWKC